MTANDLLRKLQKEVCKLSTGDIPIRLYGLKIEDADVEIKMGGDADYINLTIYIGHD